MGREIFALLFAVNSFLEWVQKIKLSAWTVPDVWAKIKRRFIICNRLSVYYITFFRVQERTFLLFRVPVKKRKFPKSLKTFLKRDTILSNIPISLQRLFLSARALSRWKSAALHLRAYGWRYPRYEIRLRASPDCHGTEYSQRSFGKDYNMRWRVSGFSTLVAVAVADDV